MVPPGASRPSASAASIMVRAGRSLSEPDGLALSSLRNRRQSPRSMRVTSIKGVSPMRSRIEAMNRDAMKRAAAVLPKSAGFRRRKPTDLRSTNLTYCAAKGLTFDPVRLCSARNGSIETFDPPPRATSVVVPSSGAGKLRKVPIRGSMPFSKLGLSDKVLAAVKSAGYTTPTPIQEQAIPHVLARRDVLGIAQTGTGKTAAFTLPMLTMLEHGRARARIARTLIVEPTRELAAQVVESFTKYGVNHKLNVALLIGGVSFDDQDAKLMRGVDVLIATPGRLLDHFERGRLLLTGVELLVIDEADRMLDMGFIPDIERICKLVPFTRQTLFFTATMPPEIRRITEQFLHNPVRVEVTRAASTVATPSQALVKCGREPHDKRDTLRRLIRSAEGLKNAIVFCNRKREVALLHRSLVRHGFSAIALHGDMDQPARTAALEQFRKGEVTLLVASDVAARGLDIPDVSHVFNFDVPDHPDDYKHRIR